MKFIKQYWSNIFFGIGLSAFILGLWGFSAFSTFQLDLIFTTEGWKNFISAHNFVNFSEAALKTIQMYVVNLSAADIYTKPDNWPKIIASILAPLSTFGALLGAFGYKFGHWFDLHIKPIWQNTDYLFIGGGNVATGISKTVCKDSNQLKIVGLALNENAPLAHALDQLNCNNVMHFGDAMHDDDLRCLSLHKAKTIWISVGNDLLNINIARRVIDIIKSKFENATDKDKIKIIVNTHDLDFSRKTDNLFPDLDKIEINLEMMPITRIMARKLYLKYQPTLSTNQIVPHILIVGTSDLAESLLIHTVQHCVYAENECVEITLAGKGVTEKLSELRQKFVGLCESSNHPAFKDLLPLAKVNLIECDEDEISIDKWANAQRNQTFNTIFVACEADEETLTVATRVAALREVSMKYELVTQKIIACYWQQDYVNKKDNPRDLFTENVFDLSFSHNDSEIEETDINAMFIKAVYDNYRKQPYEAKVFENSTNRSTDDDIRLNWIEMSGGVWKSLTKDAYRWSTRLCGDHIAIKLDVLQRHAKCNEALENDPEQLEQLIGDNLDMLARLEHKRFLAERIIEGWLPLPECFQGETLNYSNISYQNQKDDLHVNVTLVPFDQLDLAERKKDWDIINAIPEIIRCKKLMNK